MEQKVEHPNGKSRGYEMRRQVIMSLFHLFHLFHLKLFEFLYKRVARIVARVDKVEGALGVVREGNRI